MKLLIVIIFIVIVASAGSYFLFLKNNAPLSQFTPKVSSVVTTAPTSIALPSGIDDLLAGGASYLDTQGVYVFLYPLDFQLDTQDSKHIRIYKTGATQQGQTEMYDGVILVFETIGLNGQPLSAWVDKNLKTITADGTSEIVEPKQSITVNKYPGFTYAVRGLGVSKQYVLQKDTKSNYAVLISTMVSDPQNVGFQKDVDRILSTIQLLK